MIMYCQHCGHPLPDGAKFCSNCGKMAFQQPVYTPPQYQQPQVQSQQQTAPYTEPVNYKKNAGGQYPPDGYQKANHWQAPNQQPPLYTEPVHKQSGNQQIPHTVPVEKTGFQPGSGSVPPYNPGTGAQMDNSGWHPAQPPVQPQQKRVRKLPILLAAIAAVILLGVLLGGKDDGKIQQKSEQKPGKNPSIAAVTEETKPAKPEAEPFGDGPRYNDDRFLFDTEQLGQLYAETLPDSLNYSLVRTKDNIPDSEYWVVKIGDTFETNLVMTLDEAGNIVRLYAINYTGTKKDTISETDRILCNNIIKAAHGNVTEEQLEKIVSAKPIIDSPDYRLSTATLDGLNISITVTNQTMYSVDVRVKNYDNQKSQQGTQEEEKPKREEKIKEDPIRANIDDALSRHPDGTLRFNSKGFQMTPEDMASLTQYYIDQDGLNLQLQNMKESDGQYHITIRNQSGDRVGFMIIKPDPNSGKVLTSSLNYDFQPDEAQTNTGAMACLCMVEAAHGNMTGEKWNQMDSSKQEKTSGQFKYVYYKVDGLQANALVMEDSINMSVKLNG